MLRELQDAFRRGVLADDPADALALIHGDAIPAERRLAIYRNNTLGSLAGVLAAAYPVVCRLVGAAFFRHAAVAYVRAHPPARPQLLLYDDRFADFLAGFALTQPVPYLPDVARLEWARNRAYFAADAAPLTAAALQAVPVEAYPGLRLSLLPSAHLVASRFPILRIRRANQPEHETVPPVDLAAGGEAVLVLRPAARVEGHPLSPGDVSLLTAFRTGATLAEAAAAAAAAEPGFDLRQALAGHLARGTFSGFSLT